MPTTHQLTIAGYQEQPVPHTYVRNDEPGTGLAVFLPGFGYTCDMPLFYYSGLLLLGIGMDILLAEYAYNRAPGFSALPLAQQQERVNADVAAVLAVASAEAGDNGMVVIAKSIGTRALAHWLTSDPPREPARIIWLTPLLKEEAVRLAIRQTSQPSLVVTGAADPHHDTAIVADFAERPSTTSIVIPDANHSLDIGLDPSASIHALQFVLAAVRDFMRGEQTSG
ncbi:hypothetical protein BH23CHL2_BH23CHL2_21750 [soil metagenome]